MSRRIPPTPVAAPWYGSTALGGVCDSSLNATPSPSPTETTPGFSPRPPPPRRPPGPRGGARPPRGQQPERRLRALVRAVLAPHHAEHGQLEVVRVAPEPV